MSGVSIIDTVYRLSQPSERAEFDRKVEDCGAKCYQATVEFVDPPCVLTEEMLRDCLARFMEHVEVDDEEYARQRFVEVFQVGWNIERGTGKKRSNLLRYTTERWDLGGLRQVHDLGTHPPTCRLVMRPLAMRARSLARTAACFARKPLSDSPCPNRLRAEVLYVYARLVTS
jgi:hypothetical protein